MHLFYYKFWHIPSVSEERKKESNKVQIENQCCDTDKWRNPPEKTLKTKTTDKETFCFEIFLDLRKSLHLPPMLNILRNHVRRLLILSWPDVFGWIDYKIQISVSCNSKIKDKWKLEKKLIIKEECIYFKVKTMDFLKIQLLVTQS